MIEIIATWSPTDGYMSYKFLRHRLEELERKYDPIPLDDLIITTVPQGESVCLILTNSEDPDRQRQKLKEHLAPAT